MERDLGYMVLFSAKAFRHQVVAELARDRQKGSNKSLAKRVAKWVSGPLISLFIILYIIAPQGSYLYMLVGFL
jgi:hypothetical protein